MTGFGKTRFFNGIATYRLLLIGVQAFGHQSLAREKLGEQGRPVGELLLGGQPVCRPKRPEARRCRFWGAGNPAPWRWVMKAVSPCFAGLEGYAVGWAVGLQTSALLASGLCDWGGQRNGEAGLWHGAFFFNHKSTDQGGKSYPHVVHFLF